MLEAEDDTINELIDHEITCVRHLNQLVKEFYLASVGVLKHELDIQIFILEACEVLPTVL